MGFDFSTTAFGRFFIAPAALLQPWNKVIEGHMEVVMKRIALFIAGLFLSLSCLAQVPEKEQAAIVATVDTMLASLKSGDSEAAFALHAPVIQQQFESATGFADYLRENFPVLPDHSSAVVVDVDVHQGTVIAATVVDYDGAIWLVMFSMEVGQGGVWLISGCGVQRTASKGV